MRDPRTATLMFGKSSPDVTLTSVPPRTTSVAGTSPLAVAASSLVVSCKGVLSFGTITLPCAPRRAGGTTPRSPAQQPEVDDESGADDVGDPVDLLRLAGEQLQQRVRDETEGQPLRDAEGERHHEHGEEGRYHVGVVDEPDVADPAEHEGADQHEDRRRGLGGDQADERGEQEGEQEQGGHHERLDAGAPSLLYACRVLYVGVHGRAAQRRAGERPYRVRGEGPVYVGDLAALVHQTRPLGEPNKRGEVVENFDDGKGKQHAQK